LALSGLGEDHLTEAAAVAQIIVGFSTYLPGIRYSVEQFQRELDQAVEHIKSQQHG
jgi:hypothetical protein